MRPLWWLACILPAQAYLWRNESLRNPLHSQLYLCGSHSQAQRAEKTYIMNAGKHEQWPKPSNQSGISVRGKLVVNTYCSKSGLQASGFQWTAFQRPIQHLTKSHSKDRKPFIWMLQTWNPVSSYSIISQQRHFHSEARNETKQNWILPFS